MKRELWLFGYGSLMWRPNFDYEERVKGYVDGWTRRFWQGSTDHRGVPGAPGRVVTLVPDPKDRCWGLAFRVAAASRDKVLAELDHREKGGYVRHELVFSCRDEHRRDEFEVLVYVASPGNVNYLGRAPLEQIARQVLKSVGPSGHNVEYVLNLAKELERLGIEDAHVAALAELLA